jgi:hypothetical protein
MGRKEEIVDGSWRTATRVFLGLEAGVGAELVGGIRETFFARGAVGVFVGRGDPVHGVVARVFQTVSPATRKAAGIKSLEHWWVY